MSAIPATSSHFLSKLVPSDEHKTATIVLVALAILVVFATLMSLAAVSLVSWPVALGCAGGALLLALVYAVCVGCHGGQALPQDQVGVGLDLSLVNAHEHLVVRTSQKRGASDKYVVGAGDADTFFLGEKHANQEIKTINGQLISSLARQHPVLLVLEGFPDTRPESQATMMQDLQRRLVERERIEPEVLRNIRIAGWDVDLADPTQSEILNLVDQTTCEYQDRIRRVDHFLSLKDDLEAYSYLPTVRPTEAAEHHLSELWSKIDSEIVKTFYQRTEAMISALRKLKNIREKGEILIVVAGKQHLFDDRGDDAPSIVRRSLGIFYQEFYNHRAVILYPRQSAPDASA